MSPETPKDNQPAMDDVLRRLLATPPAPKVAKAKKSPAKKPNNEEAA